jgi:spermidine synthase
MKPQIELESIETPDGGRMGLHEHDEGFSIKVNGQLLMSSRQHESELALARLGCAHLVQHEAPTVLIGGLGMGYTLAQTLSMLGSGAKVTVSELMPEILAWNQKYFGALNGKPLEDARTDVILGNIFSILAKADERFDAILLDIDNGPTAITDEGNGQLYTREGMESCRRALRNKGCLAVWSAEPSKSFEALLMSCHFHVRRYKVPAYAGTTKNSRFVWVSTENERLLPPGGGEPRPAKKKKPKNNRYPRKKQ